jgi:dTMP kinase
MRTGRLIVFEGPDGCGKTTLSKLLAERLQLRGERVEWDSFPGKEAGTLGALVYRLHHHPEQLGVVSLTPLGLQAMHLAAHLDTVSRRLRPVLESGSSVVLDRFWWSTWAYGVANGVDPSILDLLIEAERRLWQPIRPAVVFLVRRRVPLRPEQPGKWHGLNSAYAQLGAREHLIHRVVELWNEGSIEESVTKSEAALL